MTARRRFYSFPSTFQGPQCESPRAQLGQIFCGSSKHAWMLTHTWNWLGIDHEITKSSTIANQTLVMTRAEVHLKVGQHRLPRKRKKSPPETPELAYPAVPLVCIAHARPGVSSDRRRLDKAVCCVTVEVTMHPGL